MIDIGTNTTRLLIAEVGAGGSIREIERDARITKLGEDLDATGRLAHAAMDRVAAAISDYRDSIDRLGAQPVIAVATSAMRDAANGPQFRDSLRERYGIEPQTISGDEEARLTFLGATAARPAGGSPTLVIDIGGGSTEFTVGMPGSTPEFAVSTRAGSVRQTERHLREDPPSHSQTAALAGEIRSILAGEVPERVRTRVFHGIAVAGTATSLAAIAQELDPYDPARVHGYRLGRAEAERITALLAGLPLSEREQIPGLHPKRAPTIVAGAVILVETMRAFELREVEVSEADILHGTVLDAMT